MLQTRQQEETTSSVLLILILALSYSYLYSRVHAEGATRRACPKLCLAITEDLARPSCSTGFESPKLGNFNGRSGVPPPPPPFLFCKEFVPVDVPVESLVVDPVDVSVAVEVEVVAVAVVMEVEVVECAMSFAFFTQFWRSRPLHAMATMK